jgi:hypothetical protein
LVSNNRLLTSAALHRELARMGAMPLDAEGVAGLRDVLPTTTNKARIRV